MSVLKYQLMLNKDMSWVPCYLKSEADKVIAHQKYKRCLAMVKYCEYRFMNLEKMIDTEYRTKKMRFSHRWWVKWLKLADKFKEDIK